MNHLLFKIDTITYIYSLTILHYVELKCTFISLTLINTVHLKITAS